MKPAGAAVEGLSVAIGEFRLRDLNFNLSAGEVLVILGPNGSGKSVTLETIAGFHRSDSGRVLIRGRDVTAFSPERRNVGFMVQNFGLFPHLTVEQNIAIALRTPRDGASKAKAAFPHGDVSGLLAHFGVTQLARRAPQDLSPGEKQRVALARALAAAPDLFLFDEPFSAIDAATRDQLRSELSSFLREMAIPAVFVSHDHTDALTLADKVVVLRDGVTIQSGTTADIFHRPANSFVASFVGVENLLRADVQEVTDSSAAIAIGGQVLRIAPVSPSLQARRQIHVAIRAEDVILHLPDGVRTPTPGNNRFSARVTGVRAMGALAMAEVDCGFALKAYLLARDMRATNLSAGDAVEIEIAPQAIHVMAD